MLIPIDQLTVHNTIIPMIDGKKAERVDACCFVDGNDDEFVIEFFVLADKVVRVSYNRRSTYSAYHWVTCKPMQRIMTIHSDSKSSYTI